MSKLTLKILERELAIYRFSPQSEIPSQLYGCEFYSITRTDDELSIVCSASCRLQAESSASGWLGFKVIGPLDFSMTGILAELSAVLAGARVSIFAISTFDTDYILVKADKMTRATQALKSAGYIIL